MTALMLADRPEGFGPDMARVHPLVEHIDRLATPGQIDSVDQDHDRKAGLAQQPELHLQQGGTQLGLARLPGFLVDAMTDFSRLEHVVSSFSRRWNRDKRILRGYNARLCRQTPSARSR
jgi:hypothetical protein